MPASTLLDTVAALGFSRSWIFCINTVSGTTTLNRSSRCNSVAAVLEDGDL